MKTFAITISLLCALAFAPAAEATWPGGNGAIAFSRTAGAGIRSTSDIWITTPAGGQRRLTATPRIDETSPTFSPDGRTIAYVSRFRGDADIWLMHSDGRGKRRLAGGELDQLQPSFFPSGRSLLFTEYDGERGWTVFSIRANGAHLKREISDATFPVASPNGGVLAYSKVGNGGGIRLWNRHSGKVRRLTTGSAQGLEFSPDGRRILFVGQRACERGGTLRFALLAIGLRGRHSHFLRRGCRREVAGATWSPNGARIVYVDKRQQGRRLDFRLRMMTATGVAISGAPRHVAGTQELFPAWQPLR